MAKPRAASRVILGSVRIDDANIAAYLVAIGQARPGQPVAVIGAGDGNINFVRRVRIGGRRTLVVKQARAALERFPEYQVTTERIRFERRYGEVVAEHAPDVAPVLPGLLHFDDDERVLVMEDLGAGPRLDDELREGRIHADALHALGRFLGVVHRATIPLAQELAQHFGNDEMRSLHGEHIFSLPYQPNDFPLSTELRAEAEKQLAAEGVRERILALRTRYYQTARALVHADVQAGNVLLQGEVPRLIDSEIAHVGDPAFDLGTALGHIQVHVPLSARPEAYRAGADALLEGYRAGGGDPEDAARASGYAGVEIMRRSIGAARLPALAADRAAAAALAHGVALLLD